MKRSTGVYVPTALAGEEAKAFVPNALPVRNPPIGLEGRLTRRLVGAEQALARLDLTAQMVPSMDWLRYAFVRKEAILSSQIEGIQATLVDLLESGEGEAATPDVAPMCIESTSTV